MLTSQAGGSVKQEAHMSMQMQQGGMQQGGMQQVLNLLALLVHKCEY
jgi:hypothetical protein